MNENDRRSSNQLVPGSKHVFEPRYAPPRTVTSVPVDASKPPPGVSLDAMIRKRWKWLVICLVAGVGGGVYLAIHYEQKQWEYTATLLYDESPAGLLGHEPPKLYALQDLATSRETLTSLREEFQLDLQLTAIAAAIKTKVAYGSAMIEVRCIWDNPEQAKNILSRALELFGDQVVTVRQQQLTRAFDDCEAALQQSIETCELAKAAQLEFNRRHQVVDLEKDLTRAQSAVTILEERLETARQEHDSLASQLDTLTATRDTMPDDKNKPDEEAVRGMLASVDLQRRQFLKERINAQSNRISEDLRLDLLESEYQRAKALYAKQYISRAEFEKIEAEYKAFSSLSKSEDVKRWRNELDRIESRMPKILLDGAAYGMLAGNSLANRITGVELGLVAARKKVESVGQFLDHRRAKVDRLTALRQTAHPLAEDVEMAIDARRHLETQLAGLVQMRQSKASPLLLVRPISPALNNVHSNRKKMFLLGFLITTTALVAPLFLSDLWTGRPRGGEIAARRLGLPVLAHEVGARNSSGADESARLLALRLQQSSYQPGSVTLFSSMHPGASMVPMLERLSHCLAMRGERVVLVDLDKNRRSHREFASLVKAAARPPGPNGQKASAKSGRGHETPTLGVADYLASDRCNVESIIHPTVVDGVDCVANGSVPLPQEGLATRQMTRLLQELRKRYTLVLVVGPSTAHVVDLEILAARADGIIFHWIGSRRATGPGEEVVANLKEFNAPILGVVG